MLRHSSTSRKVFLSDRPLYCLSKTKSGYLAGGADHSLIVFDEKRVLYRNYHKDLYHSDWITCTAVYKEHLVGGGMDGMVTIWKDKKPIRGHKLTSSLTNFHCEEMLVCGTYDGTVFWFSDTEHHTHLKMDASPVTCLLQDVSGHKSGVICDYETKNVFRAHEGQVNYLEKQEIIYSAGADAIRAFDLRLPKEKGRRVLNLEQKSVCAHRRDHQWYSLCDGTLSVMDTRTKHKQEISLHKGHPYSHCFTPTQGIAGWTDGTVSVFDLTTLDFYNVKQTDNAIRSLLVDDKIRGVGDDGLFISLCNPFH